MQERNLLGAFLGGFFGAIVTVVAAPGFMAAYGDALGAAMAAGLGSWTSALIGGKGMAQQALAAFRGFMTSLALSGIVEVFTTLGGGANTLTAANNGGVPAGSSGGGSIGAGASAGGAAVSATSDLVLPSFNPGAFSAAASAGYDIRRVTDDDGPLWWLGRFRFPFAPRYNVLKWRVQPQLDDRFAGKLKIEQLHNLVNRPGGIRVYNEDSGHYSIYRHVPSLRLGKDYLLRITLDDTVVPAEIISVGTELKGSISFRLREGIYRPAN